ncbi:MAG: DUF4339 domain-containing protein [Hyphomicrobiaceae bacterium]
MSDDNVNLEWYLAREGQQHGPLSDAEMKKFIELGHLSASDLVWRAGFTEWRTASEVFPKTQADADPQSAAQTDAPSVGSSIPTADGTERATEPSATVDAGASEQASGVRSPSSLDAVERTHDVGRHEPTPTAFQDNQSGHPGHQPASSGGEAASEHRAGPQGPAAAAHASRSTAMHASVVRHAGAHGAPNGGGQPNTTDPRSLDGYRDPSTNSHRADKRGRSTPSEAEFDDPEFFDEYESKPKRRSIATALVASLLIALVGAGGWVVYANQGTIGKIISDITSDDSGKPTAVVAAPNGPSRLPATDEARQPATRIAAATTTPTAELTARNDELVLLQSPLWSTFKTAFPDWTNRRESEVEQLKSQGKENDEVLVHLMRSIVRWRRENAERVLTAPPEQLRSLAKSFVGNLQYLVSQDVKACYGFISKGELSPNVLPLYKDPRPVGVLSSQTQAIVLAAQANTDNRTQYSQPSAKDFNRLAKLLIQRGWSEQDLKMFSDPAALSSAPAEKVCKLVMEWFDTQLQMPPSDQQMRLLATSLRPVVRG